MKYWKKLSHTEQDERITRALAANVDFTHSVCLGIPASRLDEQVFYSQASFLKDAPLLRTYVANPNHIGCHTFGSSEPFFAGTHELEREVIELLSVDFFKAQPGSCDGYVAAGGTEANIEAAWIYRNYFIQEHNARHHQVAILCSSDTHYSVAKAGNLLNINVCTVPVNEQDRSISKEAVSATIADAISRDIRFFIVYCNMGTTMFGSVDAPEVYADVLRQHNVHYKMHVDAAFGGFIYPTSAPESVLNFANAEVSSITLDAHKMLQAPYGTGIFLARKGLMEYALTKEASYVHGMDMTISGSRSGANAIAIWMILFSYGPFGWLEKINKLLYRTDWMCAKLDELHVAYYRHPRMNIITIRSGYVPAALAATFGLVPDDHSSEPGWYKIVVMDHVSIDQLHDFAVQLGQSRMLRPELA